MYALADLQLRLLQPLGPWHTKHGKAATAIHRPTSSLQKSQATRPGPIRKLWGSARVGLEVHGKVAWGMSHRYHTDPMGEPHRGGLAGERPWSKICYSEPKKHTGAHAYRNTCKTYIRLAYAYMSYFCEGVYNTNARPWWRSETHYNPQPDASFAYKMQLLIDWSTWGMRTWLVVHEVLPDRGSDVSFALGYSTWHRDTKQNRTRRALQDNTIYIYIYIYQTTSKTLCSTL